MLRLALPEGSQAATLELPCEVVRVDSAGPAEIALAFDEKSSPALEALKRFLVRVRRQSAG